MSCRLAVALGCALALAGAAVSAQSSCANCVEARFWEINPTFWNSTTPGETPEREKLVELRKFDWS
jgi:hypothetical protein